MYDEEGGWYFGDNLFLIGSVAFGNWKYLWPVKCGFCDDSHCNVQHACCVTRARAAPCCCVMYKGGSSWACDRQSSTTVDLSARESETWFGLFLISRRWLLGCKLPASSFAVESCGSVEEIIIKWWAAYGRLNEDHAFCLVFKIGLCFYLMSEALSVLTCACTPGGVLGQQELWAVKLYITYHDHGLMNQLMWLLSHF